MEAEISTGRRLVQVGFMRRYDQGYNLLKDAMGSNQLVQALMTHAAHRNPSVPERYVTPMAIHDTLIHELDAFRWLLDDEYTSTQVAFSQKTCHDRSEVRDPQLVLLEASKGIRIDVEVFVNCQYGYDIQCTVVGEEGIAHLPEPQNLTLRTAGQRSNEILEDWKKRFTDAFDTELQGFINDAQAGTLKGPSCWDGFVAAVAGDACVKA